MCSVQRMGQKWPVSSAKLPAYPLNDVRLFPARSVSISTVIGWINEVCYIPVEWALYPCKSDNNRAVGGGELDSRSGHDLQPGRYVIRTRHPGEARVFQRCWLIRLS